MTDAFMRQHPDPSGSTALYFGLDLSFHPVTVTRSCLVFFLWVEFGGGGVTVTRSCLALFTLHACYFTFSPV